MLALLLQIEPNAVFIPQIVNRRIDNLKGACIDLSQEVNLANFFLQKGGVNETEIQPDYTRKQGD
jgi:hypothetical protein